VREANHPSQPSVEIKNMWCCNSAPPYAFMARKVTTLLFLLSKPVARFYSRFVFVLSAINKGISSKVHRRTGHEDPQGE
jgi:hypothetical protein